MSRGFCAKATCRTRCAADGSCSSAVKSTCGASQRILGLPPRRLDAYHEMSMRGTLRVFPNRALIPDLLKPDTINFELPSKTRASAIRDMVALADRTGRVFDRRAFLASVEAREALCTTALPGGFAILHARQLEAYQFEGSFIVLGRTIQDIPFGASDGRPTRLFFPDLLPGRADSTRTPSRGFA